MNRIWFGTALMVLLLVLGIGSSALMEQLQVKQIDRLERAAAAAAEGDWAAARDFSEQAKKEWSKRQLLIAALCDHAVMDHIDGLFAQMEVFSQARSATSFSSTCVYLARQLEAVGYSHSFTLENLL